MYVYLPPQYFQKSFRHYKFPVIELLHGLKPLTQRDKQADPLSGAFDFTQKPRLDPLIIPPRDCPSA